VDRSGETIPGAFAPVLPFVGLSWVNLLLLCHSVCSSLESA
jgi:hypothetical protein